MDRDTPQADGWRDDQTASAQARMAAQAARGMTYEEALKMLRQQQEAAERSLGMLPDPVLDRTTEGSSVEQTEGKEPLLDTEAPEQLVQLAELSMDRQRAAELIARHSDAVATGDDARQPKWWELEAANRTVFGDWQPVQQDGPARAEGLPMTEVDARRILDRHWYVDGVALPAQQELRAAAVTFDSVYPPEHLSRSAGRKPQSHEQGRPSEPWNAAQDDRKYEQITAWVSGRPPPPDASDLFRRWDHEAWLQARDMAARQQQLRAQAVHPARIAAVPFSPATSDTPTTGKGGHKGKELTPRLLNATHQRGSGIGR